MSRRDPETGCALIIIAAILVFVVVTALFLFYFPEITR
jgi:hypothetical protein